ncbi:glycosyltransferase family 4 protein [Roseivirga sp.]|uniref:glycosyltransferase family 4 protein n=1 Tax=Roseivirga sp. TaxID=1964215 RepID=UPI003B52ECA9
MRVLFITDNFPPEVNAPATRTYEHCREWVSKGVDVTVITCAPNFPQGKVYPGYKNKFYRREEIDGIKVVRVWSYIASNEGFLKRTLDYISFAITSFFAGLFVRTDVIVATSPQFFVALSGRWLSFFKRKSWVMEVRDLWPESIKTVGAMKDGILFRALERLELSLYKSAKKVITVTDSFKYNLINRGINEAKIAVIKNGANLDLYDSSKSDELLQENLGLAGKFVLGYIGTHGLAHKLDFIIDCAKSLEDSDIHILFVGSGAIKNGLVSQARGYNLSNVTFLDPIEKKDVWRYISILDAMIVPLKRSELFKTVIPSKIFETSAMRVPILLGVDGEAREIVEGYNAGLFFEPENQESFLNALNKLRENKTLIDDLKAGCEKLAKDFDRKKLAKKMLLELRTSY